MIKGTYEADRPLQRLCYKAVSRRYNPDIMMALPAEGLPLLIEYSNTKTFKPKEVSLRTGPEFRSQLYVFETSELVGLAPLLRKMKAYKSERISNKLVLKTYEEKTKGCLPDAMGKFMYMTEVEANYRITRYNLSTVPEFNINSPRTWTFGTFLLSPRSHIPAKFGQHILMNHIESDGPTVDGYSYIEQIARSDDERLKSALIEDGLKSLFLIHKLGIIHNSIKHENLVVSNGRLFILDFSDAQFYDPKKPSFEDKWKVERDNRLLTNAIAGMQ